MSQSPYGITRQIHLKSPTYRDRINISPLEMSFQFIRIKSRLDGHMAGSVHLMSISQTNGITLKGISIHSMDGVLECQWIVEPAKLGKKKVRNAITQSNFPNTSTISLDSHSGSIRSIQSDTGFGSSNMSQKWNQTSPPNTLLPPAYEINVRMPFLESQERRVRQLGYRGGHPCNPPTWPQNDHNGSINRMTRYGKQNASLMRTGNYTNASKFQDRNELYWNKQYVNEPNYIQENHWVNSFDGGHIFQAIPINPAKQVSRTDVATVNFV